jgi:excisionase family DNA binding protein
MGVRQGDDKVNPNSATTAEPKRYVSIAEACELYGCGQTRMRALLRQNAIEAVRFGSRVLISVASADAYFSSLPRLNSK